MVDTYHCIFFTLDSIIWNIIKAGVANGRSNDLWWRFFYNFFGFRWHFVGIVLWNNIKYENLFVDLKCQQLSCSDISDMKMDDLKSIFSHQININIFFTFCERRKTLCFSFIKWNCDFLYFQVMSVKQFLTNLRYLSLEVAVISSHMVPTIFFKEIRCEFATDWTEQCSTWLSVNVCDTL